VQIQKLIIFEPKDRLFLKTRKITLKRSYWVENINDSLNTLSKKSNPWNSEPWSD